MAVVGMKGLNCRLHSSQLYFQRVEQNVHFVWNYIKFTRIKLCREGDRIMLSQGFQFYTEYAKIICKIMNFFGEF